MVCYMSDIFIKIEKDANTVKYIKLIRDMIKQSLLGISKERLIVVTI